MPMKIRHLILRQSYFKIVQDSFFSQQMVAERILMNPFLFLFYILNCYTNLLCYGSLDFHFSTKGMISVAVVPTKYFGSVQNLFKKDSTKQRSTSTVCYLIFFCFCSEMGKTVLRINWVFKRLNLVSININVQYDYE